MSSTTTLLDGIQIAKPCKANWADMAGDDRVRNCAICELDVYDLSAMTRDDAEAFVASRTGMKRTCIRFYRRADGRVLTQDCPVGVAAAWRRVQWAAAALLAGGFATAAMIAPRGEGGRPTVTPLKQIYEFVENHFGTPPISTPTMGDVCIPPPPQTTPAPVGPPSAPPDRQAMGEMVAPPVK